MAFKYTITERSMRLRGKKETIQVATQVHQGTIRTGEIARELQAITSLGRGDVKSVLEHLGDAITRYITLGYSVKLEGLGTFTPRIKSRAVPLGEKYTADRIKRLAVQFTPDRRLRSALEAVGFECQRADDTCPAPDPDPDPDREPEEEDPDVDMV